MSTTPIDLSAGMVPNQPSADIDLSAGMVPNAPNAGLAPAARASAPQSSATDSALGALAPQSVPTSKGAGSTQDVGGFEGYLATGDTDKADATSGVGAGALLGLLGANYGPGAVEAVKAAAASHPLVAKILMHGLVNAGTMKVAKMMHVFDGK